MGGSHAVLELQIGKFSCLLNKDTTTSSTRLERRKRADYHLRENWVMVCGSFVRGVWAVVSGSPRVVESSGSEVKLASTAPVPSWH